jgi:hypothetical protein
MYGLYHQGTGLIKVHLNLFPTHNMKAWSKRQGKMTHYRPYQKRKEVRGWLFLLGYT